MRTRTTVCRWPRPLPATWEDVRISKKPKTYAAYKKALEYFLESCNKTRVTGIERQDLLRFSAFLRDVKKLQPRTVYNKFENVMSFLQGQSHWRPSQQERLAPLR